MKKKLDAYVYQNLDKYRNSYIDKHTYKKLGESGILSDLKKNGYDCTITSFIETYLDAHGVLIHDTDYIVELK